MQSLILHLHVFLKDSSEQCLSLNWETLSLFFSFHEHINPEYADSNAGTGEKSWKEGGREGGGGRGGSLLKQQANTWACVPLISKRELVALMLCQVIIPQRNSRGRFAVQGRE